MCPSRPAALELQGMHWRTIKGGKEEDGKCPTPRPALSHQQSIPVRTMPTETYSRVRVLVQPVRSSVAQDLPLSWTVNRFSGRVRVCVGASVRCGRCENGCIVVMYCADFWFREFRGHQHFDIFVVKCGHHVSSEIKKSATWL